MGSSLKEAEVSSQEGGSAETGSPSFILKLFNESFPYYLSIGMTYEQFWDGDPELVRAYRKAEDIRTHRRNWEMWLNGRYIYDSVMRLIPSLNMWKPKEPIAYMDEPYPLNKKEYEDRQMREHKRKQEEMRAKLQAYALRQKKQKQEEVQEDG